MEQLNNHIKGAKHKKKIECEKIKITDLMQSDGSYICGVCENFTCTGIIPLKAHLDGQKHKKNLSRQVLAHGPLSFEDNLARNLTSEKFEISSHQVLLEKVEATPLLVQSDKTVEQRVKEVWAHPYICNYRYGISFLNLSPLSQIEALAPHFGFIGGNEMIPQLL